MKYLVKGEMEWFNDISEIEVEQCGDDVVFNLEEQGDMCFDTEFIEMIGNILYCQTENFQFTAEAVYLLAKRFGIIEMLNYSIPELKEMFLNDFVDVV